MNGAVLEHANITVSNPEGTAELLCNLFGWHIRWQGSAIGGGRAIHVGSATSYLALYAPAEETDPGVVSYSTRGGLNHIGIVVEDLEEAEERVLAAGFETNNHGDYEPGRRFYFRDKDNVEFEIIHYDDNDQG